jgi:meso-butanediol dehydrogenase/(S,S)-butanediol dehydrogenase/diacetyl reductase
VSSRFKFKTYGFALIRPRLSKETQNIGSTLKTMSRFLDKVVFVTGGTSGLGAAACQLFLNEGATVFVTDIEERDILQRLKSEKARYQRCDITSPDDCENAVNACIQLYGRLDILFSNAAIVPPTYTTIEKLDLAVFQQIVTVNICSTVYLARAAIPQMRRQGKGVIIATASTAGTGADYGLASYCAAKAGVINLCKTMAIDYAKEGIRVNAVCPGLMDTPLVNHFNKNPAVIQAIQDTIPMGRSADPAEVAKAVLFLASDDASYITGHGKFILE